VIRLKIRDSYFKIIDSYRVNESSREVKFSSLKIDFTGKTIADLPLKYQEVQLLELDDNYEVSKVIYTGYVNNFVLPKMKNRVEYRELELDLLSPLAMATVRTVDAVGTYNLQALVQELVQPLINDGFVLRALNIGDNQITVNFLSETVESALNNLSNKFNFWWYIDVNKNIYINSIAYLMNLTPQLVYDDDNKINGLIDVIPSIDATDYCNVVNFTNVRFYTDSLYSKYYNYVDEEVGYEKKYEYYNPLLEIEYIHSGDEIEFNFPFVIDVKIEQNFQGNLSHVHEVYLSLSKFEQDMTRTGVFEILPDENNKAILPSNVTIDDSYSDKNEFVLVRDPFFKNLIIGMKYNGSSDIEVARITSATGLMWGKIKILDEVEINKNKGIINKSGIVEKQIDMGEQWKTYNQLLDIANSYMRKNTTKADQVKINVDENIQLDVGDLVKIDKECFLINDLYIVTDKVSIYEDNVYKWNYVLRNTNVLENYVDLFRSKETEEPEKNYGLITASYIEEGIQERYEVSEV